MPALPLLLALGLVACGESNPEEPGAQIEESSAGSGASMAGSGGGDTCNAMSNTAPTIGETALAEDMPMLGTTGGEIVEGTYHLTSFTAYLGVDGVAGPAGTRKHTVVVMSTGAGTYDLESVLSQDGEPDDRVSFAATLSDTMMSLDITCPAQLSFGTSGYTATPVDYTLYDTAKSQMLVFTLVD